MAVTRLLFCLPLLLAACGQDQQASQPKEAQSSEAGKALDKKAIDAGILPDPGDFRFGGRYETRSDIGTDKFCAVADGDKSYAIGMLAVFGPESKCEGRGTAVVDGETVKITLSGKGSCSFEAHYDGVELRFPGKIEAGCAEYCSPRASMSGTHYFMVEPGDSAARQSLGRELDRLCE